VKSDTGPVGHTHEPDLSPLERQQVNVNAPHAHTFWHWVRFDIVASVVARSGATQVVDVGAGSGMLGTWLAERHPQVGYRFDEISPLLEADLIARFGAAARHPSDAAIERSSVVSLLDVIEHIDDDRGALTDLADRMADGSSLVVTVPAMPWAFSSWDSELGHFRRYTRRQLRELLHATGFDVVECSYLFPELTVLLPARKLRRAERSAVDFPTLSPTVNRVGYAISSLSSRVRRIWPFGSSLVAIATANGARNTTS
jgi:Methyltransferase domain